MREFVIAPETEGKGRSFGGYLAAYIAADGLWAGGEANTENLRPVWAVVMSSEAEIRPLVANLRMGKKAVFGNGERPRYGRRGGGEKLEFLKSAKFSALQQRSAHGVAMTLYLHDLFTLDPGMVDPEGVKFVLALPAADVARQVWDREAARKHVERMTGRALPAGLDPLVDLAPYFAAYLERRSRYPWPSDTRFYLQLLYTCLDLGLASLDAEEPSYGRDRVWGNHATHGLDTHGLEKLGFTPAIAFKASHEDIMKVLGEAVSVYFDLVGFDSAVVGL